MVWQPAPAACCSSLAVRSSIRRVSSMDCAHSRSGKARPTPSRDRPSTCSSPGTTPTCGRPHKSPGSRSAKIRSGISSPAASARSGLRFDPPRTPVGCWEKFPMESENIRIQPPRTRAAGDRESHSGADEPCADNPLCPSPLLTAWRTRTRLAVRCCRRVVQSTYSSLRSRGMVCRRGPGYIVSVLALSYPLECVLVPCVIGGAIYLAFELVERWRRRTRPHEELPAIDYMI